MNITYEVRYDTVRVFLGTRSVCAVCFNRESLWRFTPCDYCLMLVHDRCLLFTTPNRMVCRNCVIGDD